MQRRHHETVTCNYTKQRKMSVIERHIEYLIRRHDCVVVPGVGSLLCRYEAARFADTDRSILPPGRKLAFNSWLSESDGMLEASVARRERVSMERAAEIVTDECSRLLSEVRARGEAQFGRIGRLILTENGEIALRANEISGVNGAFFGLLPISPLTLAEKAEANLASEDADYAVPSEVSEPETPAPRKLWIDFRSWRAYASGAVATLAVIVTLAFFVAFPIKVGKNTQTASIAPVSTGYQAEMPATAEEIPEVVEVESIPARIEEAEDIVSAQVEEPVAQEATSVEKPSAQSVRLNDADPYIVVVASFPTEAQARTFMAHSDRQLGFAVMDGKYRVYAATASDYSSAMAQAAQSGIADAWVCHRR